MKKPIAAVLIVLFISCGRQSIDVNAEKEAIIKSWVDWEEKAKAGDPAYYWTDDVVIMGPGGPTIKGKEEFVKMLAGMQNNPGFNLIWDKEPSVIEISKDGQMAYLLAKNKVTMTDSTGAVQSGFNQALQVWKKDNEGKWKAAISVMYPESRMK
jgi:ketosteroid isomerase-like protein